MFVFILALGSLNFRSHDFRFSPTYFKEVVCAGEMLASLCTFLHILSTAPFWLSEATADKAGHSGFRCARLYKDLGVRAVRADVFRWRQRLGESCRRW